MKNDPEKSKLDTRLRGYDVVLVRRKRSNIVKVYSRTFMGLLRRFAFSQRQTGMNAVDLPSLERQRRMWHTRSNSAEELSWDCFVASLSRNDRQG